MSLMFSRILSSIHPKSLERKTPAILSPSVTLIGLLREGNVPIRSRNAGLSSAVRRLAFVVCEFDRNELGDCVISDSDYQALLQ